MKFPCYVVIFYRIINFIFNGSTFIYVLFDDIKIKYVFSIKHFCYCLKLQQYNEIL